MTVFVILHYQAIEETLACVESIKKHVTDIIKIIVVDNCSPNGTGITLQEKFIRDDDVDVILHSINDGFARGNNVGYKAARKYNPDYIVVLNSDTIIPQNNFSDLINQAFEKYNFDVLGPDIYSTKAHVHQNPQRRTNYTAQELEHVRRKLALKNKFKILLKLKYLVPKDPGNNLTNTKEGDFSEEPELGVVLHGAFYVFSKKFIDKHEECFFNKTFMYFESYILHYLGMKDNEIFLYYPKIRIEHHEDASTNATYKTQYKKSLFVNKCLLDSCKEFIELIN